LSDPSQENSKKFEIGSFPKYRFLCKDEDFALWPKYIGEKVRILGHMGYN